MYSHGSRSMTVWSAIWKDDTIPNVKTFTWKLLTNSIAVLGNLRQRGMNVIIYCPVCGMEGDKKNIWYINADRRRQSGLAYLVLGQPTTHDRLLRNEFRSEASTVRGIKETRWKLCMMTCWIIWKARCKPCLRQRCLIQH